MENLKETIMGFNKRWHA